MMQILLIGLGSAIGGVCRYLLDTSITQSVSSSLTWGTFPWGILFVNILASFLIGLAASWSQNELLTLFFITGFCGGFSTFSSFSLQTIQLFEAGKVLFAILNVILSLLLCFGGAAFGLAIRR